MVVRLKINSLSFHFVLKKKEFEKEVMEEVIRNFVLKRDNFSLLYQLFIFHLYFYIILETKERKSEKEEIPTRKF